MESYYTYQEEIERKYGDRSVILMMVGSFYEMYEYEGVGQAQRLSPLLNITLTKKDKKKEMSRTNPYMCGFPSHSLRKFVDILVGQLGYTVGIVDQLEEEPTATVRQKKRGLAKVYSPCIPYEYDFEDGSFDGSCSSQEERVCLAFSIQRQSRNHLSRDQRFFLSYILLNLSFGHVLYGDEDYASIEEVRESLSRIYMKEHVQEVLVLETSSDHLLKQHEDQVLTHHHPKIDGKYRLLNYQQKVLSRVYKDTEEATVISELDLERHPCIVQYLVFLLDFVFDHCPLVLSKMKRPVPMRTHARTSYNIRTYYELNILNHRNFDRRKNHTDTSLIDLVDKTCTPMGSRRLRHLCFVPTYDMDDLERRYDRVEKYVQHRTRLKDRRLVFNTVGDMEKRYRSMCLDKISPKDMAQVLRTIESLISTKSLDVGQEREAELSRMLRWASDVWDWGRMDKSRTSARIDEDFYRVPDENVHEMYRTYEKDRAFVEAFVHRCQDMCQMKMGNDDEVWLVTTKRKWTLWKKDMEREGVHALESKGSAYTLHSPDLDACTKRMQRIMQQLRDHWRQRFSADLSHFCRVYGSEVEWLCRHIAEEDVYMAFAHVAILHKYCRPILTIDSPTSAIVATGVRHAVIERIQDSERFVENDVRLDDGKYGMLVYGLNSAGKSTLLKSIGLCVLMAQIGMFVPCASFHFQPFQTVLSKIFVMDDIYRAQSTFLYELNELKTILNQCGPHSLVLCDELTSGTETYSATGLMASTLLHCIDKRTRFLFTTHLHTLSDVDEIVENDALDIVHFAVSVTDGRIQYDRKLAKGMGSSLYGIEIADAVGFPSTFTKKAFDVRNRVSKQREVLVQDHRSRYNKRVVMDACEECGAHTDLHTHHIIPQKESDEYGYISTFHKNRRFNLRVLCERCHIDEHRRSPNPFEAMSLRGFGNDANNETMMTTTTPL